MQASRDLNILHRLWKNELGPVSKEFREELWTRFQKASNKIHAKRQKHQKEITSVQNKNSLAKEKVLGEMKDLAGAIGSLDQPCSFSGFTGWSRHTGSIKASTVGLSFCNKKDQCKEPCENILVEICP